MNRRHLLTGGVALAAAAAGAGWAVWRERQQAALHTQDDALWTWRFEQPDGGTLALADLRGRPLLVNFWATWCPPCLHEMPLLDTFHQPPPGSGWQVLGLAVDNVDPVKAYLKRSPVGFPIGVAGFGGLEQSLQLGNTTRQLPFSVLIDRQGAVIERKLGAFDAETLKKWSDRGG